MSLRAPAALLPACLALLLSGCDPSLLNPNRGRIELVKPGMNYRQVVNLIGPPEAVIYGKGMQINWKELVYERGSVFLYRMRVQKVLRRKYDKVKPRDENDMLAPYKERNIFEETPGTGAGRK